MITSSKEKITKGGLRQAQASYVQFKNAIALDALILNKTARLLKNHGPKLITTILVCSVNFVCFAQDDSLYNKAIKQANTAYEFKWLSDKHSNKDIDNFENAKGLYAKALEIRPEDKYASDRIIEINRILDEIKIDEICEKLFKEIPSYHPKDLGECFLILDSTLCDRTKEDMKALPSRKDMIRYHRGLGMYLRNSWGLWSSSDLRNYFKERGVFHPDDMSSYILDYYYDWLHGDTEGWKKWVETRDKRHEEFEDE